MAEADKQPFTIVVDDIVVGLKCKACDREMRKTIGQLKAAQKLTCEACGKEIESDTSQLARAAERAQEVVDRLKAETRILARFSSQGLRQKAAGA